MSLTLGWSNPLTAGKAVGATLFVQRNGGMYNFSQTQFMEPMYNVNLTTSYQFNPKARGHADREQPAVFLAAGQRQRDLAVLLGAPAERQRARARRPTCRCATRSTEHVKFTRVVTLAAGLAIAQLPGATVRAESGSHADSPLKLTEIIARPKIPGPEDLAGRPVLRRHRA